MTQPKDTWRAEARAACEAVRNSRSSLARGSHRDMRNVDKLRDAGMLYLPRALDALDKADALVAVLGNGVEMKPSELRQALADYRKALTND